MTNDELMVSVSASSEALGVVPVALVAFVEVVDPEGNRQVVKITTAGISESRARSIASDAVE